MTFNKNVAWDLKRDAIACDECEGVAEYFEGVEEDEVLKAQTRSDIETFVRWAGFLRDIAPHYRPEAK